MDNIRGITFTGIKKGKLEEAKESLSIMKTKTCCNTVIIIIAAWQETAHSEFIDYKHAYMPLDEELIELIDYCEQIGLRVILKPQTYCKDGTWRAHINFFDIDVVCEPKWSKWFENYTDYQMHYAKIAEKTGCEMFVVGCEMVQSQRREAEWRTLINNVRTEFGGLISYNTDKYQEDQVSWWDAVDVISSSGYYPIDDWDNQLDRIEAVVNKFNKPFIFGETGCRSCNGASREPNNWMIQEDINLKEQEAYYKVVFEKLKSRSFIQGMSFFVWCSNLYKESEGIKDRSYGIYGKPACNVVYQEWNQY